jgi:hypothetical protein
MTYGSALSLVIWFATDMQNISGKAIVIHETEDATGALNLATSPARLIRNIALANKHWHRDLPGHNTVKKAAAIRLA